MEEDQVVVTEQGLLHLDQGLEVDLYEKSAEVSQEAGARVGDHLHMIKQIEGDHKAEEVRRKTEKDLEIEVTVFRNLKVLVWPNDD